MVCFWTAVPKQSLKIYPHSTRSRGMEVPEYFWAISVLGTSPAPTRLLAITSPTPAASMSSAGLSSPPLVALLRASVVARQTVPSHRATTLNLHACTWTIIERRSDSGGEQALMQRYGGGIFGCPVAPKNWERLRSLRI